MHSETGFNRVFVACSPLATHHDEQNSFINSLRDWSPEKIPTAPDIVGMRAILLGAGVGEDDLVVVFGGDGSWRLVGLAVAGMEGAPLCAAAEGGNANNDARSLDVRRDIHNLLRNGREAVIHPMEVTVRRNGQVVMELGSMDDVSVGAAGSTVRALHPEKARNARRNRVGRFISEVGISVNAVANHYPMTVVIEGREKLLADVTCSSIPWFGKHGRTGATPFSPFYARFESPSEGRMATRMRMGKLALGRLTGTLTDEPTVFTVETADGRTSPLQAGGEFEIDGKLLEVDSGSNVTIQKSDNTVRVLTTRPIAE